MGDKLVCKLFILAGSIAIILQLFSLSIAGNMKDDEFRHFSLELMCMEDNGTYLLSDEAGEDSCSKIVYLNYDQTELETMCARCYPDTSGEEYESCASISGIYTARRDECLGKASESSAENELIDRYCSIIVNSSQTRLRGALAPFLLVRGI